ncbi:hypothetical protein BC936DRAFT_139827 [Jimgerdemannia flammicorona]|uniref:Uncharacterized protein n=1 Tax=Jimgerdemannia flammicorona TaxID=994334 RepID=A0A433B944_9FUNG|nr:hypothetical protein BC936DRAFT_139827 [Jimgerdemannia flammicorona]
MTPTSTASPVKQTSSCSDNDDKASRLHSTRATSADDSDASDDENDANMATPEGGRDTHELQDFSAADYDPSQDRIADDERRRTAITSQPHHHMTRGEMDLLKVKDMQENVVLTGGTSSHAENMSATDYREMLNSKEKAPQTQKKVAPALAADFDMFAEDVDDMFATPDEGVSVGKKGKADGAMILDNMPVVVPDHNPSLLDNWDDPEGYYRTY